MAVNDNPYVISSQGGTKFKLNGLTAGYVVEILGGASLTGDMLALLPVTGQTGKVFSVKDVNGTEVFSIDKTGAVVAAAAITATGGITGVNVVTPVAAISTVGASAVTIAAANKTYFLTAAGIAAPTIVDPTITTHDGVTLTFIATTANAHTLSNAAGSGFFSSGGASKDIATFGGAIGDRFSIIAYQAKWYILDSLNITLG